MSEPKYKKITIYDLTLPKIVLSALTFTLLLLSITITAVNAEAESLVNYAPFQTDVSLLSVDESPEFQTGRKFLNQAWNALKNDNNKLAFYYFSQAEKHFSKALEKNPDNIPILMHRATTYVGLEKYDLAFKDFDKTLELNPLFAPGYEGKALIYEITGNLEKAQEMKEAANAIYDTLASKGKEGIAPNNPPSSPNSGYTTWYASNARHSYTNRFTGQFYPYDNGFSCGVWSPWKANIENAVYFNLPWVTWNRYTEGLKWTVTGNWVNLTNNTQGYTNAGLFSGWSVPAGENYVLLISETEVCFGFWVAIPSYFRISASYY